MSEITSRPSKSGPPSDISQVLRHGPAMCQAYGRPLGAFLMIIAMIKARHGYLGIGAAASLIAIVYQYIKQI